MPSALADRLRHLIRERGPITFDRFMEAALYDPEEGFFSRTPVGERGAFVTSPHVSPVFAFLLAKQVAELWELLDRPRPFAVVEVGAGDGTLARQLLAALPDEARGVTRYVGVERSAAGRAALASAGITTVPDLGAAVGEAVVGCVLANEVLDNVPFRWLRGTDRGPVELVVGVSDTGFVLVEGPPADPRLTADLPPPTPGGEVVVSPEAIGLVRRMAGLLSRGYVWVADYGTTTLHDPRPLPRSYEGHREVEDVLGAPGSRDITAGVDFRTLARSAHQWGCAVWGPRTQREALLALGFERWSADARERQRAALAEGRGHDAARIFSARTRAALLVDPSGLGSFHMLCLGVGVNRTPSAFAAGALTGER